MSQPSLRQQSIKEPPMNATVAVLLVVAIAIHLLEVAEFTASDVDAMSYGLAP